MFKMNSYPIFIDWTKVSAVNFDNDYQYILEKGEFGLKDSAELEDSEEHKARITVAILQLASENKLAEFKAKLTDILPLDKAFMEKVLLIPFADALLTDGIFPEATVEVDDEDIYNLLSKTQMSDKQNALAAFYILHHQKISAEKIENFKNYINNLNDKALADEISAAIKENEKNLAVQKALKALFKKVEELIAAKEKSAKIAQEIFSVENSEQANEDEINADFKALEEKLAQVQADTDNLIQNQNARIANDKESIKEVPEDIKEIFATLQATDKSEIISTDQAFKTDDNKIEEQDEEDNDKAAIEAADNTLFSSISRNLATDAPGGLVTFEKQPSLWERCKQKWNAISTKAKVAAVVFTVLGVAAVLLGVFLPPSLAVTIPLLKISSSALLTYAGAALAGATLIGHAAHIALAPAATTKQETQEAQETQQARLGTPRTSGTKSILKKLSIVTTDLEATNTEQQAQISSGLGEKEQSAKLSSDQSPRSGSDFEDEEEESDLEDENENEKQQPRVVRVAAF